MKNPQEARADTAQVRQDKIAKSFFTEEERILNDIAGGSGFAFKRGEGWAINPETGEGTYDQKFFTERGYTQSQSLFASFHEVDHVTELAQLLETEEGKRTWEALKAKKGRQERTHLLWNFVTRDPADNKRILRFAPALDEDATKLYREKLFPTTDFRDLPLHLQLIHTILRTSMLPDEVVLTDPKVVEAIEAMKHVRTKSGEEKDVIDMVTNPDLPLATKIKVVEGFIEPAYEALFQDDVKNQQNKQDANSEEQGEDGDENSGKNGDPAEKPFRALYKKIAEQHLSPMEEGKLEKKIKETKERRSERARQTAGYQQEHGVSKKDAADYYEEYRQVKQLIEPLRDVFRRIVEQRKIAIRRLTALKEEGVMIDPGLVGQTYLEVKAGVDHPKTMKDFEGRSIDENIPSRAYIYWEYDQSISMEGKKAILQRRGAIVAAETLKEGEEIINEEQLSDPLALDIQTAFFAFGSPEGVSTYKPLSKGLTEKQRIALFKGLLKFGGVGTNDYDGLVAIEEDTKRRIDSDPIFATDLKNGKCKVCVIVTTDGGSNYKGLTEEQARLQTRKKVEDLRRIGVKVKAIAFAPSVDNVSNIQEVYGVDDTTVCTSMNKYPESIRIVLERDVLSPLSITGNPEDLAESGEPA